MNKLNKSVKFVMSFLCLLVENWNFTFFFYFFLFLFLNTCTCTEKPIQVNTLVFPGSYTYTIKQRSRNTLANFYGTKFDYQILFHKNRTVFWLCKPMLREVSLCGIRIRRNRKIYLLLDSAMHECYTYQLTYLRHLLVTFEYGLYDV